MGLLLSGAQDHHGQKASSINRDRLCPLLSDDQIRRLDAATAIALGYPHNLNRTKRNQKMNGCCRITPEWSASLTLSGLWKACPSLGRNRIKISPLLGEYSILFAAHKTGSAVLSRQFGHPNEFPGAVLGEKPDDILLRISDK